MLRLRFWGCLIALSYSSCFVLLAVAQVTNPSEVDALRAVKSSLINYRKHLRNWNKGDPCNSSWTRVLCFGSVGTDGYFHIRELQLLSMNLSGTLAPELGKLSQLVILDFMWNDLSGSIPKEIGNITSLELLLLNGNKLLGSLPDELGYLANLNRLQVDQNHISGLIPKSFVNLSSLRHLHMNNNSLSGQIPSELSEIPTLLHMLLDNNNLSGYLPPEFSNIPGLRIMMLKSTKTLASEKKRKLSMACQQQRRTQSQPRNLTQRRTQPQQQPQPPPQTRQKPPPQPRQQHPPQPNHAMVSPTRAKMCEEGQDVFSSLVKKTRGITRGVGTHAVINASEKRIPIQMNHEQKLPRNIKANAMFSSAIGSFTRKHAPLIVKTWKKVSDKDKTSIITALTTQFDFDYTDPSIRKHIEDHMAKSYGQWKCKLHKHFKNHANDLEYARAHPPSEKLWGKRQMTEWEWLCDELWTKEDYQKRCKINANNRGKLKYNHCGGSRPFQKHMEASQEKGENVTIVENWGIMHQHQGGLGTWVNEEAEAIGKKMLDELQKEKQKLAEMQDTSIDKISVPISTQLEILTKEVGVMKGKTIRGLGYGPQRETICNHANHSKTDLYTTEELLSAMGQMALQIEQLEGKFAAYVKQNTSPPCDDGIGEDDEEMDEEDEEEDLGYMH